MSERLQKVLARAGVASRRAAERMIEQGRVSVNGEIVSRLGVQVDPGEDHIRVDGRPLAVRSGAHRYLMLNKPRGYVTTLSDPEGRPTVSDLIPPGRGRLFPVGRLDYHTEGLLLLTDDGDLAHRLMHPSAGVEKTYAVKVRGRPDDAGLERLRRGLSLDGRRTRPARVRMVRPGPNSWLEITISEGRKHQVRRMFEGIGHLVVKLRRTAYGGVRLGRLDRGMLRPLTAAEVAALGQAVGGSRGGRKRGRSARN